MDFTYPIASGLVIALLGYFLKQKDNTINKSIEDNIKALEEHKKECNIRNENLAKLEERLSQFMNKQDKAQGGVDNKFETISDRLLDIAERLPDIRHEHELKEEFKDFKTETRREIEANRTRISAINVSVLELMSRKI